MSAEVCWWAFFDHGQRSPYSSVRYRLREWLMGLVPNDKSGGAEILRLAIAIAAAIGASWGYIQYHGATQVLENIPSSVLQQRARPDPWTGTQGRETREMLKDRIGDVSAYVDKLSERVDYIDKHGSRALEVTTNRIVTVEGTQAQLVGKIETLQRTLGELRTDVRVILSVLKQKQDGTN
jgi:hypothetical protein